MKLRAISVAAVSLFGAFAWTTPAQAHCDTLDGPVVSSARKALDTGNANLVLVWVQKADENDIRHALEKARSVRKAGGDAKELADRYFFETLVRVHRAGEGAPYTGLKPAGTIDPAVAAADKAIESGNLQPLAAMIAERTEKGLHGQFAELTARKSYRPDDVNAGRAYVGSYVTFVHYAEKLYDAAGAPNAEHAQAPAQAAAAAPSHAH